MKKIDTLQHSISKQSGNVTGVLLIIMGSLSVIIGIVLGNKVLKSGYEMGSIPIVIALIPALSAIATGLLLAGFGELIQIAEKILKLLEKKGSP